MLCCSKRMVRLSFDNQPCRNSRNQRVPLPGKIEEKVLHGGRKKGGRDVQSLRMLFWLCKRGGAANRMKEERVVG